MLAAVELATDKASRQKPSKDHRLSERVLTHALEEGLVFRAFSDDILGFAPALNYTKADVDTLIQILRFSLDKAVADTL